MTTANKRMQRGQLLRLLQIAVHVGAWIPLIVLVVDLFNNNLTINPIQEMEKRTGSIAITLLILSLACTPLYTLLRVRELLKINRPLGLYAYMYAAIHLAIFLGLDYGIDPKMIWQAISEKPFIIVGLAAFILLSLLAITSFRWWMARMGKNWKKLHRVVYAINLLVLLHFAWSVKGDFFRLQGDIIRPLIATIVVILLLALRIPAVRRSIAGQRKPTAKPSGHIALGGADRPEKEA